MDCFYQGYGIFSPSVLVTSTGEITLRSEDAGKTWTEVGRHGACGPVWFFKGKPYWMSNSGILTSGDAGKTWTLVGSKLPAWGVAGPYFGKDERHVVVATATGFYESFDGCNAWHKLAPYPPVFSAVTFLWSSFGYDPVHDVLYAHTDRTQTKFKYGESGVTGKLELRRWAAAAAPTEWSRAETTFYKYERWSMRNEYQWSTWAGIACAPPCTVPQAMRLMAHAGMNALGYPGRNELSYAAERWGWRYYNEGVGMNTFSPVIEYEDREEIAAAL